MIIFFGCIILMSIVGGLFLFDEDSKEKKEKEEREYWKKWQKEDWDDDML